MFYSDNSADTELMVSSLRLRPLASLIYTSKTPVFSSSSFFRMVCIKLICSKGRVYLNTSIRVYEGCYVILDLNGFGTESQGNA